jgi:uncharacterized protein YceH (UPF0502 family)
LESKKSFDDEKQRLVSEMADKIRDLKDKTQRKLKEKDDRIAKLNTYIAELDKRLDQMDAEI